MSFPHFKPNNPPPLPIIPFLLLMSISHHIPPSPLSLPWIIPLPERERERERERETRGEKVVEVRERERDGR
jgi:hypothetical protein